MPNKLQHLQGKTEDELRNLYDMANSTEFDDWKRPVMSLLNTELDKARIDENERSMRMIPALDKHSGAAWYRGYVSAQQTLRNKLKKRIASLKENI